MMHLSGRFFFMIIMIKDKTYMMPAGSIFLTYAYSAQPDCHLPLTALNERHAGHAYSFAFKVWALACVARQHAIAHRQCRGRFITTANKVISLSHASALAAVIRRHGISSLHDARERILVTQL